MVQGPIAEETETSREDLVMDIIEQNTSDGGAAVIV
jgi:hypothetical protein